jgi:type IV pilus assembly protein PilX
MKTWKYDMPFLNNQRGSALIISLIFLLLLTIIGVAGMQSATMQERMAGNTRDRNVAFQAAEGAMRGAEDVLAAATLPPFNNTEAGYRLPLSQAGKGEYWMTYDWKGVAGTDSGSQAYTTRSYAGVAEPPRYVVEQLPSISKVGESVKLGPLEESGFYRITTRAVGSTSETSVILQSVFKRD